jgi:hypothetical protein
MVLNFPPRLLHILFASPAGGLRNCNAAPFASFKNTLRFFLNPPRRTEPKEAAYAVTVLNSIVSSIILKNAFYNFIKRFKKIQKNEIQIQIV